MREAALLSETSETKDAAPHVPFELLGGEASRSAESTD
jgi:hypothetical protein